MFHLNDCNTHNVTILVRGSDMKICLVSCAFWPMPVILRSDSGCISAESIPQIPASRFRSPRKQDLANARIRSMNN